MAQFAFLVLEPGQASPRRVPVEPGLTLGRHPQCGCVLQDGSVSGRHARVGGEPHALTIEDMGGTNPTQVNGRALQQGESMLIPSGTVLTLGQTRIDVVAEGAAPAPPTAQDTLVSGGEPADATTLHPGAETVAGDATMVPGGGDATMVAGGVPAAPPPPPQGAPPPPPPPPVAPPPPPAPQPTAAPAPAPAPQAAPPAPAAPVAPASPAPPVSPGAPDAGGEAVPAAQVPAGQDMGGADGTMATLVYGEASDFDPNDPATIRLFQAMAQKARPRLVFANESDRRVVEITSPAFTIGRARDAECNVAHPGVSSQHARILFVGDRFFLEDLGGRNKTFLNKRQLAETREELTPEAHLALGPVDALFVVDIDADGHPVPAGKYACALDVLSKEGVVQPAQKSSVESQATAQGRHVGEVMLLQEIIDIPRWRQAFEKGELQFFTKGAPKPGVQLPTDRKVWVIAGLAVLILILVLALVL